MFLCVLMLLCPYIGICASSVSICLYQFYRVVLKKRLPVENLFSGVVWICYIGFGSWWML